MQNLLPSMPELITYGIILLTAFPIHEFAHAWTANYFGDNTPRANGRLTLNPLAHLDPIGSILMIVAGFGWAKPVPVNPYILMRRSSAAPMLVSLAGPMSNFLMAILAAIAFRTGLVSIQGINQASSSILPSLAWFLFLFILVNLWLMLFNLLPLFPLDGEKVLTFFLPKPAARFFESIRPYGTMILMVIIFVLPMVGIDVIGGVIRPALGFLTLLLIGV